MSHRDILDSHHDDLARALIPGCAYETKDGCVFHVLKVDNGSKPGEFPNGGRRPAQARVFVLSSPRSVLKEGSTRWLVGREIEWLVPKNIA